MYSNNTEPQQNIARSSTTPKRFSTPAGLQIPGLPYVALLLICSIVTFAVLIRSGFGVGVNQNSAKVVLLDVQSRFGTTRQTIEDSGDQLEEEISDTKVSDCQDTGKDSKIKQPGNNEPVGPPLCPNGVPDIYSTLKETNLTRDSILVDFAAWDGREFTLENVHQLAENFKDYQDTIVLFKIQDNKLTFPNRDDDCTTFCNGQMLLIKQILREALAQGKMSLPDTEFVVNVHDFGKCPKDEPKCVAPIFSYNRRLEGFIDILIPVFQPTFQVHYFPWEEKLPKAFFRGSPFCSGDAHFIAGRYVNCSRLVLTDLAQEYPEDLNVTILSDFTWNGYTWKGVPGGHIPVSEHAKYQMVLNLDGFTGSTRFAMLLAMNSVVLKQDSPYIEFYSRSVKPCVHYLPFWEKEEKDVLEVIDGVRRDPKTAQKIIANAQAFALTHLNTDAKYQYWERAIREYDRRMKKI